MENVETYKGKLISDLIKLQLRFLNYLQVYKKFLRKRSTLATGTIIIILSILYGMKKLVMLLKPLKVPGEKDSPW